MFPLHPHPPTVVSQLSPRASYAQHQQTAQSPRGAARPPPGNMITPLTQATHHVGANTSSVNSLNQFPIPPVPFQFVRLKSFSPHSLTVLKKLETAILAHPNNPQAYLALGEEYRQLGARHSFIRLLEFGKEHFPTVPAFRTLLYQHQPNRPRTPPPQEPAIQMERNSMYDYKWRHREQNLFPKQLLRLDTSVRPLGQQLRQQYLQFLSLVQAEDIYVSQAQQEELDNAKKSARADDDNPDEPNPDDDIAITIPVHFNKMKDGPQAIVNPELGFIDPTENSQLPAIPSFHLAPTQMK